MPVEVESKFPVPGTQWTSVGVGLVAPVSFRAWVHDEPGCPYELELLVEIRDGRPQCTELKVTPPPGGTVGTADLRKIRLRDFVALALAAQVKRVQVDDDPEGRPMTTIAPASITDLEGVYATASGVPDRDLAAVARVYREAAPNGKPTLAVSRAFSISHSTAQRRVREARAAGFDMPAAPRRPNKVED